jgi:hypothetical protein
MWGRLLKDQKTKGQNAFALALRRSELILWLGVAQLLGFHSALPLRKLVKLQSIAPCRKM